MRRVLEFGRESGNGYRVLAAALLLSCDASAPPACADGQQNPCKCDALGGTQVCSAGRYSACDCTAARAAAETQHAAEEEELAAIIKAEADQNARFEKMMREKRDAEERLRISTNLDAAIVGLGDAMRGTRNQRAKALLGDLIAATYSIKPFYE